MTDTEDYQDPGPGRPREIVGAQLLSAKVSARHVKFLQDYEDDNNLNGKSASLRHLIDKFMRSYLRPRK